MAKMRDDYTKALQAATAQTNVQVNIPNGGGGGGGAYGGPSEGDVGPRPMAMQPMPNMPQPAMVNGQPDDSAAFLDRATGEDVRNDWEVTVVVLVQLDPPPPTAPAAAPAAQQASAQH